MANWLQTYVSGTLQAWAYRTKLTIDGSKVDGDFTDFPVLVHLGDNSGYSGKDMSDIFTTISGNSKKIAITGSDGITQQYVEIEDWDSINQEAWLWTKVPTISSGTNQSLYLYYDINKPDNTTYVGDTGDAIAKNVWKSSYKMVWHLNNDPSGGSGSIKDSTFNSKNGTPYGSMDSSDLIDGQIAGALDFDGSDDYVRSGLEIAGANDSFTIKVSMKRIGPKGTNYHLISNYNSNGQNGYYALRTSNGVSVSFLIRDTARASTVSTSAFTVFDDEWHRVVAVRDAVNDKIKIAIDGEIKDERDFLGAYACEHGGDYLWPMITTSYTPIYIDGSLDELEASNYAADAAEIKLDNENINDNLISFGPITQSLYYFSGTVEEFYSPVQRKIRAYRADTGDLMDETISTVSGTFTVNTTYSGLHYIICLADYNIGYFNDLIYGQMIPALTTVS